MKRHGATPEEDIIEWVERMGFTPEDMTDIWSARSALARILEGTVQYPGTARQMRAMDWAVREVYRPMHEAGVRPTLAYHPAGYWDVRYAVRGERGLYGWEKAQEFIRQRTGVQIRWGLF